MKIIAVALMVLGLGLGYWGYEVSNSLGSQISEAMQGAPTDKVMMLYIGGVVSFIVGVLLFFKK